MAGAYGIMVGFLEIFFGFVLIVIALILLLVTARKKRSRGGYITSLISLACAVGSTVVSGEVMHLILFGPNFPSEWVTTAEVCLGIQLLTIIGSILSVLRHRARPTEEQAGASN